MTIVVAAHTLSKEIDGIWFAADSMISRDRPVLCEYKKIHEVIVRVNAPRFRVHSIAEFDRVIFEHPVAIAFAGDLTIAHHILNQVVHHLSRLVAFQDDSGKPTLNMACDFDMARAKSIDFHPHDYPTYESSIALLTAGFIADVVRHAFNLAVQSGRRYKFNEHEVKYLFAQVLMGARCPQANTFHLYSLLPSFPPPQYFPEVLMTEIERGHVVTSGVQEQEGAVQACRDSAERRGESLGAALFSYLVDLVDSNSIATIGHPCVLKRLDANGVHSVRMTGLSPGSGDANPNLKGKDHVRDWL